MWDPLVHLEATLQSAGNVLTVSASRHRLNHELHRLNRLTAVYSSSAGRIQSVRSALHPYYALCTLAEHTVLRGV